MTIRREHLAQDLRYAVRGLRSKPMFTLAVTLTLALGIGANTAMFSVVDRLLFRPPALLRDPARAHRVYLAETYRGKEYNSGSTQYARYLDLTNFTHSFERTAEVTARHMAIGIGTEAREMQVGAVSAGFFGFFDAPPAVGRYFTSAEDTFPQGAAVAVLGYGYWQTRYGGRPNVLGQTMQIGATLYTIIGVAPRGFVGLWADEPPAAYVPIATYGAEIGANLRLRGENWWSTYHWRWAWMIAQRKPGVTIAAADADLTAADLKSLGIEDAQSPPRDRTPLSLSKPHGLVASIVSERGPNESGEAKVATWLGGVALIVLLIACGNVANLLLARALERKREIAARLAGVAERHEADYGVAIRRAHLLPKTAHATDSPDPRTAIIVRAATPDATHRSTRAAIRHTGHPDLTSDLKAGAREGAIHPPP